MAPSFGRGRCPRPSFIGYRVEEVPVTALVHQRAEPTVLLFEQLAGLVEFDLGRGQRVIDNKRDKESIRYAFFLGGGGRHLRCDLRPKPSKELCTTFKSVSSKVGKRWPTYDFIGIDDRL